MDPSWSFAFIGFRRERRRDLGELSQGGFQVPAIFRRAGR
jgi:hypothetical protein